MSYTDIIDSIQDDNNYKNVAPSCVNCRWSRCRNAKEANCELNPNFPHPVSNKGICDQYEEGK